MNDNIWFGPSGVGELFWAEGNKNTLSAPGWLSSKGLNAYEYSFGRGYTMNLTTAEQLGEEAEKHGVLISVHAPYYINLANPQRDKIEKSFGYIIKGFEYLRAMKGKKLVIHIGSQLKNSREDALALVRQNLKELIPLLYSLGFNDMYLCPETMGKYLQIGDYKEIIDLCTMDKMLVPTFDFGHINCVMQGELKTEADYKKIFDYSIEKLGIERTKNCHIHFSKIEFSVKGEIRHLNYDNACFGPDFNPLANVIKEYSLTPSIICESKENMVEDAIELKKIYTNQTKY